MSASSTPLPGKEFVRTVADRRAAGRALRKEMPRSSHAEWSPASERPDPISLLEEQNVSRQAQLVPIRYGRMAASPFGFLRGAAVVMAQDLAATPVTGLEVQVCGDAHLSNFGVYATPRPLGVGYQAACCQRHRGRAHEWVLWRHKQAGRITVCQRIPGADMGVRRHVLPRCLVFPP